MEYYNCENNPWVGTHASYLAHERMEAVKKHEETEAECLAWKEHHRPHHDVPQVQIVGRHWTNESCRSICEGKCRWNEAHLNFGPLRQHHYACCKQDKQTRYCIEHLWLYKNNVSI